jgi:hypothetical protein
MIMPFFIKAQTPGRYHVLITEIMADPAPMVGLPNNEWIEIKNVSSSPINVQGWRISDASGQSGPMPFYLLQPDSMLIICTNSAVSALSAYGAVISVTSFPSLDNDGDLVYLITENNLVMHAIDYTVDWYQNELKKEGGWTLEMIDPGNPCAGSMNWKSSTDSKGGTPGSINSVNGIVSDLASPQLKKAYSPDKYTIILEFDEPIDSSSAAPISNYRVDNGLTVIEAILLGPLFNKVQLTTRQEMETGKIYLVTVTNIRDCNGLMISGQNEIRVGITEEAMALDLVINEILFNPRSNANDFVEYYNRSQKIIDGSELYIANRNNANAISSARQLTPVPFLIFPGDYVVVTSDLQNLQLNYLVKYPGAVLIISSLPSFPDNNGFVLLLNKQGEIIDEVNYDRNWHLKLLDNDEGVSLERINPEAPSQKSDNWQSAASSAGFGTPTYINSQFRQSGLTDLSITVTPKIFSPDNDGFDDFTLINFILNEPGYIANVTIFDGVGRPVKYLVRNGTLAQQGSWKWDGLNEDGQLLPIGNYIILTEIFNLQGSTKKYKNVVVLAKRM